MDTPDISEPQPATPDDGAPPVFTVPGSGGELLQVDLSVPGAYGDLAFTAATSTSGRPVAFSAYHTGEAFICVQLLHAMAFGRPTADVLADLEQLHADVRGRTNGVAEATNVSENSFEQQLHELAGPPELSTQTYSASAQGSQLVVATRSDGVSFQMIGEAARPGHILALPRNTIWRFVAGMEWRSYNDRGARAPMLTRLSTAAYASALDSFERGVRER